MYKIGEFSKITKTTCRALRFYEQEGLLIPAFIDEKSGYRYYERSQLSRMAKIISLRNVGLSVKEIKEVLDGDKDVQDALFERKRQIEQIIVDHKVDLSKVEQLIKDTNKNFEVNIKKIGSSIVFYRETILDDHSQLFDFIHSTRNLYLNTFTDTKCLEPKQCYICYIDNEYRDEKVKVRYVQLVNRMGIESEEIKFMTTKPMTVISVYMQGSYNDQIRKYEAVLQFAQENELELLGQNVETYIFENDKDNAIPYLFEFQFPVKKNEY